MTRRSDDAYPDFQSVSHQPTGFSRWSLSLELRDCPEVTSPFSPQRSWPP